MIDLLQKRSQYVHFYPKTDDNLMKVLVATKYVVDYNVRIRIKPDQSGIDLSNVKMSMNPFDEIAIEEALRLKEAGKVSEVVAVSLGKSTSQEVLRLALARGADRAILVETEEELQPLAVARLLKAVVEKEKPQLVILGKQAIDDDSNQTGQMLAALLDWPQGTFISELQLLGEKAEVTREMDGGLQTLKLDLPAIITVDLRLNEPRHISLPSIMNARKKPLEQIAAESLGIDIKPHLKTLKVTPPKSRVAGSRVATVEELVMKLKEAQVI